MDISPLDKCPFALARFLSAGESPCILRLALPHDTPQPPARIQPSRKTTGCFAQQCMENPQTRLRPRPWRTIRWMRPWQSRGGNPVAATRVDQAPVDGASSSSHPGGCPASQRVSFRRAVASRGFQPGRPRHSARL
jgi:hypothetical protein